MRTAFGRRQPSFPAADSQAAGQRLLATYAELAGRGEHLLKGLLGDRPPQQWEHYPDDDAVDMDSGFQWFYHSHAPEDRSPAQEHGHVHLFARRPLWARRMRSNAELAFAALTGNPRMQVPTRHLLAVGLDAKGIPISLFTVNSWVTGDLMLSGPTTLRLLRALRLDTGHRHLDAVIESVVRLHDSEIEQLLKARDEVLTRRLPERVLADESLEILSSVALDLDAKLA